MLIKVKLGLQSANTREEFYYNPRSNTDESILKPRQHNANGTEGGPDLKRFKNTRIRAQIVAGVEMGEGRDN